MQEFRCPNCGGAVERQGERVVCVDCARDYPIAEGIFDFRQQRRDYYFNPVPRDEMAKLVSAASAVPWDVTVRRFLRGVRNPAEWVDNVVVNGRYSWKLVLELPANGRVLDLGCGLGNLTSNLAPHVAEVVALDLTWERLLFAHKRFEKFNPRDRITLVAGGDGKRLPFPDAHFDCIALSGVLEWVADDGAGVPDDAPRLIRAWKMVQSFFGDTNPRRTQIRFLKELRRVLKPAGQLMVAIENRLGYEYFTGRPDHHSRLVGASLMPRLLANLYSIVRSRRPYRTYTHSYRGFKRLFSAAGFDALEFHGLTPGYSGLAEIIPGSGARPYWMPSASDSWKERLKRSQYFVPAYGIVASQPRSAGASMLERMLDRLAASMKVEPGRIKVLRLLVSGKDKTVLFLTLPGRNAVVKIPCTTSTAAGEENNWRALRQLAAISGVAVRAPEPLARESMQGLTFYVESEIPGHPLGVDLTEANRGKWATLIGNFLNELNAGLGKGMPRPLDADEFDALVTNPIERMRQSVDDQAACDTALRYFSDRLRDVPVRVGRTHGDLTRNNVFVESGILSGAIDWEHANERGLPVLDTIAYVESVQRLLHPASQIVDNSIDLAALRWNTAELELLQQFYELCGVDMALHPVLCHLNWLHHVSHQLDTTSRFAPRYINDRVRPLLARLAGT